MLSQSTPPNVKVLMHSQMADASSANARRNDQIVKDFLREADGFVSEAMEEKMSALRKQADA